MNNEYLKSVRLNEAGQRALLTSVDAQSRPVEQSKRTEERSPFYMLDVPVQITHPDGAEGRFLVCLRNISSGGVAFLHGGFLYPGSKVVVLAPTIWGGYERLKGHIANCRHVEGKYHEIGVAFDKPCDRRRYLTLTGETPLDPDPDATERGELAGHVLYVDVNLADTKLATFHLKDSRVSIESAASSGETVERFKSTVIDAVMLSSAIPGVLDGEAIGAFRGAGYKGPILIVCGANEAGRIDLSALEGDVALLIKPYSPAKLIEALRDALSQSNLIGDGPIYSELASNPDAIELVEFYLTYVEQTAGSLRAAVESDDYEAALSSCKTLMETGTGYGFTPVTACAKVAVTELSASMSINESITEIQRLLGVCQRLESKAASAKHDRAGDEQVETNTQGTNPE